MLYHTTCEKQNSGEKKQTNWSETRSFGLVLTPLKALDTCQYGNQPFWSCISPKISLEEAELMITCHDSSDGPGTAKGHLLCWLDSTCLGWFSKTITKGSSSAALIMVLPGVQPGISMLRMSVCAQNEKRLVSTHSLDAHHCTLPAQLQAAQTFPIPVLTNNTAEQYKALITASRTQASR